MGGSEIERTEKSEGAGAEERCANVGDLAIREGSGKILAPAEGAARAFRVSDRSTTVAITATLADIAQRIPDEQDRRALIAAANAVDETIVAIPHDDERSGWVQAEEIPVSIDAIHRGRMVSAMGIGTSAGDRATDWVDVNEAMRMHNMLATFVDREESVPADRLAIKSSIQSSAEGPRFDGRALDVEGIISKASEKYQAQLMPGRGWVESGSVPALEGSGLAALEAAIESEEGKI